MTLPSNILIQHIETLLHICRATLSSKDAAKLQQQQFQFAYVDANELTLIEITRALSEQIEDDSVLSYFRMLLRYALIEQKHSLGGFIDNNTIELLREAS